MSLHFVVEVGGGSHRTICLTHWYLTWRGCLPRCLCSLLAGPSLTSSAGKTHYTRALLSNRGRLDFRVTSTCHLVVLRLRISSAESSRKIPLMVKTSPPPAPDAAAVVAPGAAEGAHTSAAARCGSTPLQVPLGRATRATLPRARVEPSVAVCSADYTGEKRQRGGGRSVFLLCSPHRKSKISIPRGFRSHDRPAQEKGPLNNCVTLKAEPMALCVSRLYDFARYLDALIACGPLNLPLPARPRMREQAQPLASGI